MRVFGARSWIVLITASSLAAGCSSSTKPKPSGRASTTAGSSAARCPAAAPATFAWPTGVPSALPKPAGGALVGVRKLPHKGVVVSVSVPQELRDQVIFVRSAFATAGVVLGRGDAEADEADIPFRRGPVAGQLRLRDAGACKTTWVLTILGAAAGG